MDAPHISHNAINSFAKSKINIQDTDLTEYRAQAQRVREGLKKYISAHPDYNLLKIVGSGSLAKHTALKTLNDFDMALYLRASKDLEDEGELLNWLAARLREAYPTLKPEQIEPQTHCVKISFRGSELDVDVVPVIYEDGVEDRGFLIVKNTGQRVLTSITLHKKFIKDREDKSGKHYRQLVRIIKWWVRQEKRRDRNFHFKSFMVELILAHLFDTQELPVNDYPAVLEKFFAYIVQSRLNQRIVFEDNYTSDIVAITDASIEILDPVNPENNITNNYTEQDREKIVEAAREALDRITEARFTPTKGRALECWKYILGPTFN